MELDARTIERIYTGGLTDRPWQALIEWLRAELDAIIIALAFRQKRGRLSRIGVQAFSGNGRALWDRFQIEYPDFPTFPFEQLTAGTIYKLSDVQTESPQLVRLKAELHQPLGVGECYAIALWHGGALVAHLVWVKSEGKTLSPAQAQWVGEIAPHLSAAVGAYHRMRIAELSSHLLPDALGRMEVGLIAIDHQSRILFSNSVADTLVARCPDLGVHGGKLVMSRADLASRLEVSRSSAQAAQVLSRDGTMIGVMMTPVQGGRTELGPGSRPERTIFLHEVARSASIPEQLIAELFGLSRAEAKLAALLCSGLSLREAAAELGVTENSARTYSKLAYSKLGVSRQAELVRIILTSVAIFGSIDRE